MCATTPDDHLLRGYLLGNLTPELLESVDRRLFSDDRIFLERLSLVEDELVDDYVDGRLERGEADCFERAFLSTEERKGKVEFARALHQFVEARDFDHAAARADVGSIVAAVSPATGARSQVDAGGARWQPRRMPLARRISAPVWLVAVAATLLLVLPIATSQFSASRPSTDQVSASLSTGLVRDVGGEVPRVRISSGCRLLQLRLEHEGSGYSVYRATVYATAGGELWSAANLHAVLIDGRQAVVLLLPADLLQGGDYFVRLSGAAPEGRFVSVSRYDFRVLRE